MAETWRVLVATDDLVEQKLIAGLLTKRSHPVHVVATGDEALRICAVGKFDVVLLDAMLMEPDAFAVICDLRSRATPSQGAVILVLGDESENIARLLEFGANGCLARPFRLTEFDDCVLGVRQPKRGATDVVDWQVALDAVGGRRDLLSELVDLFMTEYPTIVTNIREAVAADNAKSLQLAAHRLKGCLRYFGTSAASDLSRELEDIGRTGFVTGATEKLAPLDAAIERLLPLLRRGPE